MINKGLALLTSLVMSLGLYPTTCQVTNLDRTNDIVTITDSEGFTYQYYGCEDYSEGDYVSAIMFDNHTEYITDDAVVYVIYSGYHKGV